MRTEKMLLGVGGVTNVGGVATSVKVAVAAGEIEIKAGSDTATLRLGETFVFDENLSSVGFEVRNLHDSENRIELQIFETEKGEIKSPSSSVKINNEPTVNVKLPSSVRVRKFVLGDILDPTVYGDGVEVPADPERKRIIIKARKNIFAEHLESVIVFASPDYHDGEGLLLWANESLDVEYTGSVFLRGACDVDVIEFL
ncbi:hypothetical protein [Reinekea thalattae]|uniref:Uncharacterized protein n=1 Tax=Reinekea thalattae TaxID=2593301 RepID=A0A5C8Z1W1_9GAMM|nr:hypothetical protein [Reinekea thalattae]TXR52065.1 hypothetical protein FME95_11660 [Reinekea thalattae]